MEPSSCEIPEVKEEQKERSCVCVCVGVGVGVCDEDTHSLEFCRDRVLHSCEGLIRSWHQCEPGGSCGSDNHCNSRMLRTVIPE